MAYNDWQERNRYNEWLERNRWNESRERDRGSDWRNRFGEEFDKAGYQGQGSYGFGMNREYGRDFGRDYRAPISGIYGPEREYSSGQVGQSQYGRDLGQSYGGQGYGNQNYGGQSYGNSGGQYGRDWGQNYGGRDWAQNAYGSQYGYSGLGGAEDERGFFQKLRDFFRGESQGMSQRRGPKGWKRSDERLYEEVCEVLADSYIDSSDITVRVEGAEVMLEGTVPTRNDKRVAEMLAERVRGVDDVHNHLRVKREELSTGAVSGSETRTASSSTTGRANDRTRREGNIS
jgi:hypothetical protein